MLNFFDHSTNQNRWLTTASANCRSVGTFGIWSSTLQGAHRVGTTSCTMWSWTLTTASCTTSSPVDSTWSPQVVWKKTRLTTSSWRMYVFILFEMNSCLFHIYLLVLLLHFFIFDKVVFFRANTRDFFQQIFNLG